MRILQVSGLPEQIEMARNEIDEIVNMVIFFKIKFYLILNLNK